MLLSVTHLGFQWSIGYPPNPIAGIGGGRGGIFVNFSLFCLLSGPVQTRTLELRREGKAFNLGEISISDIARGDVCSFPL